MTVARFLEELYDFIGSKMQNIHTDNGTAFHGRFHQIAKNIGVEHWWSRVRTPKDSAMNERVKLGLFRLSSCRSGMSAETSRGSRAF